MNRPFKDKRPFGPFVKSDSANQLCEVHIYGDTIVDTQFVGQRPPPIQEQLQMSNEELAELEEKEFGEWKFESNITLKNCRFSIDEKVENPEEQYETRYILTISEGGTSVGELWIIGDQNPLLSHLNVDDEYKGTEVSNILFSIFYGHAVATDSESISGSIGGGERTLGFFTKMGISKSDIEMVDKGADTRSAKFETDLENIDLQSDIKTVVNGSVLN